MNSRQIQRLLENLIDPARAQFAGVFPRDKVPNHKLEAVRYPYCYVANTDTSESPGSHWVAFYFPDPDSCEFFDSYGLHPVRDYHFTKPDSFELQMCNFTYQTSESNVCGHYVIYFLSRRALNHSLLSILDNFLKGSPEYNDSLVHLFVRRRFKIRNYLPDVVHFHTSVCNFNQSCIARSKLVR